MLPDPAPCRELPHYRLVVVCSGQRDPGPLPGLAERFDALLGELNPEYRSKRDSGRLGGIQVLRTDLQGLRGQISGAAATGLDSQSSSFRFIRGCGNRTDETGPLRHGWLASAAKAWSSIRVGTISAPARLRGKISDPKDRLELSERSEVSA